jgi:hypothetical protein
MQILTKITEFALQWNGVEELPGNGGWKDKKLQGLMEEVGWQVGWPWCACAVKMIYYNVFKQVDRGIADWIMEDFTASATETYQKCEESPRWRTIIKQPVEGSIVCWRKWNNGKPDWTGHEGIVISPGAGEVDSYFESFEGNTNSEGSRIGSEFALKTRRNNWGDKDGLVVEGFILPPVPLNKLDPQTIKL